MANFITRVELHGADAADYEKLHTVMAEEKFYRTVMSAAGQNFMLPTAMYFSYGEVTAEQVRDLARVAASRIGRPCWVFTATWTDAAWYLPETPQAGVP